jgi:hypothetical protein
MKKIISFGLWGDEKKYISGAYKNIELAQNFFPDWICRFYLGTSVSEDVLNKLKSFENVEIVFMGEKGDWSSTFWRFFPASEDVDVMISRDVDSRLSLREKIAIDEWLNSDKGFHIIRDHPYHRAKIQAGLLGVKKGVLKNMKTMILEHLKNKSGENNDKYGIEEVFLRDYIYPIIENNCFVHDEFTDYNNDIKKSFPIGRIDFEFCGDVFDENDKRDENLKNVLKQFVKKEKIAFLIPSTSKGKNWNSLEDTFFYKFFIPSFLKTKSNNFDYIIYFGFDYDDKLYLSPEFLSSLSKILEENNIKFYFMFLANIKKGHLTKIWNALFEKAYQDDCDYFYQCGDDIEFLNENWDELCINELKKYENLGLCAPKDERGKENNNELRLSQALVSRKHMKIFGYFFPEEITNWFCDDWITWVYTKAKKIYYIDNLFIRNQGGVQRYDIVNCPELFISLVERDWRKI